MLMSRLFRIDLVLFMRNRMTLFWTLAFPLFMLVVQMTFFGQERALGTISVHYNDQDQTASSRTYVDYLREGLTHQHAIHFRLWDAKTDQDHPPSFILTIPAGFGQHSLEHRSSRITLESRLTAGALHDAGSGILRALSDRYNVQTMDNVPPIALQIGEAAGGTKIAYSLYLATGLCGMIILSTSLMGFATTLVSAREGGLFKLYQLFPMSSGSVLGAWWASRVVLSVMSSLIMLMAGRWLYGMPIMATPMGLLVALFVLALGSGAFLALGLVLATYCKDLGSVNMFSNLLYFILLFSGDLMIPVAALPERIQTWLNYLPLNSMIVSLRALLNGQAVGPRELQTIGVLTAVTLLALAVSARRFSFCPRSH